MAKYFFFIILSLMVSSSAMATTYVVNSQTTFDAALVDANTNDSIVWEQGVYEDIFMDITKSNLVVTAEVSGATQFTGDSRVEISGDFVTFSGFQFVGGNIGTEHVIEVTGSYNLLSHLNIEAYTSYKYLIIDELAQYDTISYCNFENRVNLDDQNIMSILVDDTNPGYHTVKYCSFKNFDGTGGDLGIEPIRIGVSSQSEYISRTTVEYCYFTQCNGDGEIISSKARQNLYRYNTFEDNPEAELVLRHGSENIVYGNFFLNGMGGVRVREGQDHVIYNNYFSGLTSRSIYLQNEASDPLANINIGFNTFVNTAEIILGGSGSNAPTQVTLANNILTNSSDDLLDDETGSEVWIGNLANGTLGIPTPPSGVIADDPELELNEEGFYGLGSDSPAINAADNGYPDLPEYADLDIDTDLLFDIMKQSRPSDIELKDVGCSEFPQNVTIQPLANENNTGPSYLSGDESFTLTIETVGEGSVILSPSGGSYEPGTVVTLTPSPSSNFVFSSWGGDLEGSTSPISILMDGEKSVTATFEFSDVTGIGDLFDQGNGGIFHVSNPVNQEINVGIKNSVSSWLEAGLFDLTGKKVKSLSKELIPSGEYTLNKDISDLLPGTYLLHLRQSDLQGGLSKTQVLKISKQ